MSEQEMTKADNRQRYIELGYNIAYYRKHAGLTQEQLAEKAGISRPHMGADRSAESLPSHFAGAAFQSRRRAWRRAV